MDYILDEDDKLTKYKKKGVGIGHSKSGKRKKGQRSDYFEEDLLIILSTELNENDFKARFIYSPIEIEWFFDTIKHNAIRPRETECHARNKLLLWLDKLHNSLSYQQMHIKYKISIRSVQTHLNDILKAIMRSYKNKNVIKFPTMDEREYMAQLLKKKGVPMPDGIFALDGSHTRCTGRNIKERLSQKYKWLPCFNVLFVVERVFGTICAFNLDCAASKHDITVLRESWFYNNIDELMDGWIILADKGYIGVHKETNCIAAVLKQNMDERKEYSNDYWYKFNVARGQVETIFAQFFHNKFTQLGKWPGKSKDTFTEFSANVICGIILYNTLKMQNLQ